MAERQNGRTAEWQNGRTAERQNGRMAERQNGRMAERQNADSGLGFWTILKVLSAAMLLSYF